MSKKTARIIAVVLGVAGAIFIAAGPVFDFIPTIHPAAVGSILIIVIAVLLRKAE